VACREITSGDKGCKIVTSSLLRSCSISPRFAMFPSFRDHKTSSISSPPPPNPPSLTPKSSNKITKTPNCWTGGAVGGKLNLKIIQVQNNWIQCVENQARGFRDWRRKWSRNVRACEVEEAATEESQRDAAEGRRGAMFLQTLIHCLTVGGRLNPSLGVHWRARPNWPKSKPAGYHTCHSGSAFKISQRSGLAPKINK
jgi:hypothetical protein